MKRSYTPNLLTEEFFDSIKNKKKDIADTERINTGKHCLSFVMFQMHVSKYREFNIKKFGSILSYVKHCSYLTNVSMDVSYSLLDRTMKTEYDEKVSAITNIDDCREIIERISKEKAVNVRYDVYFDLRPNVSFVNMYLMFAHMLKRMLCVIMSKETFGENDRHSNLVNIMLDDEDLMGVAIESRDNILSYHSIDIMMDAMRKMYVKIIGNDVSEEERSYEEFLRLFTNLYQTYFDSFCKSWTNLLARVWSGTWELPYILTQSGMSHYANILELRKRNDKDGDIFVVSYDELCGMINPYFVEFGENSEDKNENSVSISCKDYRPRMTMIAKHFDDGLKSSLVMDGFDGVGINGMNPDEFVNFVNKTSSAATHYHLYKLDMEIGEEFELISKNNIVYIDNDCSKFGVKNPPMEFEIECNNVIIFKIKRIK